MRRGEVWRVTLEPTVGDRLIKKSGLKHPTKETGFFNENIATAITVLTFSLPQTISSIAFSSCLLPTASCLLRDPQMLSKTRFLEPERNS
jgi:hypothetical protein